MSDKPDFSAQTAEAITREERRAWAKKRAAEFRAEGATVARVAWDPPGHGPLFLIEAWRNPKAVQGEPQFFFAAGSDD